jgi:hypothetical protein
MKNFFYTIAFLSFLATGCATSGHVVDDNYASSDYNEPQEVTYQTFYNELEPYGSWIDYPGHGFVWQPNVGSGFRPYETNGRWVSTVDGWAWASNYNWGWAPFHYGRWLNDPAIGWAWVPGYEWAPAWVTWGQYDDYYAWAPLAPGITLSFGNTWRAPYDYWSFVPYNYINNSRLDRYVSRNRYNANVVNNITIINNYNTYSNHRYYAGPDYRQVQQQTRQVIRPVRIANTTRPGSARVSDNAFATYRPRVSNNSNATSAVPAPGRIRTIDDLRANSESRRYGLNGNVAGDNPNRNNTIGDNTESNRRRIYAPNRDNTGSTNTLPETERTRAPRRTSPFENGRNVSGSNVPSTNNKNTFPVERQIDRPRMGGDVENNRQGFPGRRIIRESQAPAATPGMPPNNQGLPNSGGRAERIERIKRPENPARTQQPSSPLPPVERRQQSEPQRFERPQLPQRTVQPSTPQTGAPQRIENLPMIRRPERARQ